MPEWDYLKIDLNDPPGEATDLDLLDKAGAEGWELIVITTNSIGRVVHGFWKGNAHIPLSAWLTDFEYGAHVILLSAIFAGCIAG